MRNYFATMVIRFILIFGLLPATAFGQSLKNSKATLDSVKKYGVEIEPFLKKVTNQKIVADFNYSPYINKFLKEHKYVKFPPYPITIGLDSTYPKINAHIVLNSGNRIYFPKGSQLLCPAKMATNGNMVYIDTKVKDVFLYGIYLIGSKANSGYQTSQWGCGIALFAPSDVTIKDVTILKSSGDGIAVRTNWGKQSENISISNAKITNASRAGMLVTGIINGRFDNIVIEGTGEKVKEKVVKPQVGLTFEPNDCTSKYVNCRFSNLKTKNNLGPVLSTANFGNLFVNNTCGANKIDVVINGWTDITDDPACYGATFDMSTADLKNIAGKYKTNLITGKFVINNASFTRNKKTSDYYYFHGKDEIIDQPVKYEINNLKLINQGKSLSQTSRNIDSNIKELTKSSKKVLIR